MTYGLECLLCKCPANVPTIGVTRLWSCPNCGNGFVVTTLPKR